ncbi:MAG: intermembrane phospholipid transport protein YdbH family protein [Candidatus Brocadiales bacterium]
MAGINNLECDVRRIGFTGLDLGGLYIGDSEETSISIESVRVDYSITGLLRKHIDSVVIAGVEFNCEFSNGEFIIPGLDWQSFLAEQTPDEKVSEVPEENLQIPVSIGSLKIRNAVLVCDYNGQNYRIPFDLQVVAKEGKWDMLDCTLRLYPRGQELTLSSSIDLPGKEVLLKFHFDSFHLDRFGDIASILPCLKISGNIEATCNLQLPQWDIESSGQFFITLEQSNRNQYCPLQVLEPLNTTGEFSAKFAQNGEWEFKLSNVSPSEKSATFVRDCKIRFRMMDIISKFPSVTISGEGTESKGKVKYTANLYGFNLVQENTAIKVPSISLIGNVNLDSNFKEGTADFELKISDTDVSSEYLTMHMPELSLGGEAHYLKDGSVSLSATANFENTEMSNTEYDAKIKVPLISLTGKANLDSNFKEGTADFGLKISDTDVSSEYLTMHIPELSLGGEACYLKDGSVSLSATVNFENTEMSNTEYNTKVTGIGGEIPFQWPCEDLGRRGNFLVEDIDWNNLKLGTVSGTIRQSGLGMVFEGNHDSNLLPGLTLNFKGNAGYFAEEDLKVELDFSVPRFNSNSVDLGEFISEAEGILFSGELEVDGNLFVDAEGNIKCSMNTVVQNSSIELEEQGVAVEGINCTLSMPDLLSMRSAPNQQFSFKKASFGEIAFSDGKIGLQIESPETIFVEKFEFKWCNGHVYTHAMRVPLYEANYDITLLCDRLELSKILGQFGITKAEGSGTVNGRIPIKFVKGKLSIDNGFLYSTPGKGGTIHIIGTDILDIGIPRNIPQYSQLDFAKEALKNFSYNWVTLSLNTEEDDLLLQMSLDGKSMEPLPFTYDRRLGSFVRIQASSKGGINYPIHFDINFRFPVNKILYFGQSAKDIFDKLR